MDTDDPITLVVTPPPTPNGPLHLGHLFGPYVAGDIAARAARSRGQVVLTQCGLDSNQNYVLAKAQALGEPVHEVARRYGELIRQAFAAARIEYDIMADPMVDHGYRADVVGLFTELVETKAVEVGPLRMGECAGCGRVLHHARVVGTCPWCAQGSAGGTCEGCGGFRTALDLLAARSTCCDAEVAAVERNLPVLWLDEYRDALCRLWSTAVLPPRLRELIARYLDTGLPDVPLAYPSDWGLAFEHAGESQRIDVWAEMALANLYLPARFLQPGVRSTADCVRAWQRIEAQWIFMGVDNAFYYAIMIPALHLAAGLPVRPIGCVVNEFYRLAGAKFSTSRDHAIWAVPFLADTDAGLVRAFGCWDRPDRYQSDFTVDSFAEFRHRFGWIADPAVAQRALDALPERLAEAELIRGEQALELSGFDPALALRAAIASAAAHPARARRLLDLIIGSA